MNQRRLALACVASGAMVAAGVPALAATLPERLKTLLDGPKARLAVVLVDLTASIVADDWQLYEQAVAALLQGAEAGDRIMLAKVHDRPGSRFMAYADHSFKVSGNSMHDKVHARRAREALQADFAALRDGQAQPARSTMLVDALSASGEWFAQGRARGQSLQLLVLSDMVEESAVANFARDAVTPALAERVIEHQRSRKLLPDLAGVQVFVVGASGRDAAHMARVRDFWRSYFDATGATLRAYGRSAGALAR